MSPTAPTARYIGSDHREIFMTPDEVIATLDKLIYLLGTYDITTIRASMGMYLICKAIHEQTDIRVLLTGEISDELKDVFYGKFRRGTPAGKTYQERRAQACQEIQGQNEFHQR